MFSLIPRERLLEKGKESFRRLLNQAQPNGTEGQLGTIVDLQL